MMTAPMRIAIFVGKRSSVPATERSSTVKSSSLARTIGWMGMIVTMKLVTTSNTTLMMNSEFHLASFALEL